MLQQQYTLLVEHAREVGGGKFDLLGAFDRITTAVPARVASMSFVSQLVTDTEDDLGPHDFTFILTTPSGKETVRQGGKFDLRAGSGGWLASTRVIFRFDGLPLEEHGHYLFAIEIGGAVVAAHPLEVVPPGFGTR
jgi:hypothetical protein